jgi:hypothetical protein
VNSGALSLRDYPGDLVRLRCDKCGRAGQYAKDTLIIRFGADVTLPDLRQEIARCERQTSMLDPCGVHFEGLT